MPLTKSESPNSLDSPNAPKKLLEIWLLAARPKTWIASISPILIGTALAARETSIQPAIFFLTLLFSLLIQIGTNYANDYFDFLKGGDTSARIGPLRAVQQGWIAPSRMLQAALFVFLLSFVVATPLMMRAGWWSYPIALAAISFGLLYTGGPKPLGYLGLGEIFVFVFFGPIAVCGSYFLQTLSLSLPIFIASLAPALLSCALLIANNLRDEDTDRAANKKTLVVRWGRTFGIAEYLFCLSVPFSISFLLVFYFHMPLGLLIANLPFLLLAIPLKKGLAEKKKTASLLPLTALLFLLYTCTFCLYAS